MIPVALTALSYCLVQVAPCSLQKVESDCVLHRQQLAQARTRTHFTQQAHRCTSTSHRGSATAYTGLQLAAHFCGIGWVLHVLLSGAGGAVVRLLKLQRLLSTWTIKALTQAPCSADDSGAPHLLLLCTLAHAVAR